MDKKVIIRDCSARFLGKGILVKEVTISAFTSKPNEDKSNLRPLAEGDYEKLDMDWFRRHFTNYPNVRELKEKGLALKAPQGMYNTKG